MPDTYQLLVDGHPLLVNPKLALQPWSYTGGGNVTPEAPNWSFNTNTRILSLSHATLAGSELEISHDNGSTYVAYTGGLVTDDNSHPAGEYLGRTIAAPNRNPSSAALSPAIEAKPVGNYTNPVQLNIISAGSIGDLTDVDQPVDLVFSNANGTTWPAEALYSSTGNTSKAKIRGNSTAGNAKKPLSLTLNAKKALLQLYNDDGFNELAEAFDPLVGARNATMLNLAAKLGLIAAKYRPLEVYDNGVYYGLSTLTEKVKQALFNFEKLGTGATDQIDPNVQGGYLYQLQVDSQLDPDENSFKSADYGDTWTGPTNPEPHCVTIDYPKSDKITAAQTQRAKEIFLAAEASLSKPWADTSNGPQAFFEAPELAKMYLLMEFSGTQDAFSNSVFLYKFRAGKLRFSPWDFDQAWPLHLAPDISEYTPLARLTPWFTKLFADADFLAYVKTVLVANWQTFYDSIAYLRAYCKILTDTGAVGRNYSVWNFPYAIPGGDRGSVAANYQANVDATATYMSKRLGWLGAVYGAPAGVVLDYTPPAGRVAATESTVTQEDAPSRYYPAAIMPESDQFADGGWMSADNGSPAGTLFYEEWFYGTGVNLIAPKRPSGADFSIGIDGFVVGKGSSYSENTYTLALLGQVRGLRSGYHKLQVYTSGGYTPSDRNEFIPLDADPIQAPYTLTATQQSGSPRLLLRGDYGWGLSYPNGEATAFCSALTENQIITSDSGGIVGIGSFVGTGFDFYSIKTEDAGNLDIYVDGILKQTISQNSFGNGLQPSALLASIRVPQGTHTWYLRNNLRNLAPNLSTQAVTVFNKIVFLA